MTDRDRFAAAALTGLLAAPTDKDRSRDYWSRLAYEAADAMLRDRAKSYEKTDGKRSFSDTTHDAAPAARAEPQSVAPQPRGHGTGDQTAPPCVEADGSSPAIAQPPASSNGSGDGRPLDDTRPDTKGEATGGRGHFLDSRNAKQEPVAWAIHYNECDESLLTLDRPSGAEERYRITPLYSQPQTCPYVVGRTTLHCSLTPFTLTAEEREAICQAVGAYDANDDDEECAKIAATLRSLLERTKL